MPRSWKLHYVAPAGVCHTDITLLSVTRISYIAGSPLSTSGPLSAVPLVHVTVLLIGIVTHITATILVGI